MGREGGRENIQCIVLHRVKAENRGREDEMEKTGQCGDNKSRNTGIITMEEAKNSDVMFPDHCFVLQLVLSEHDANPPKPMRATRKDDRQAPLTNSQEEQPVKGIYSAQVPALIITKLIYIKHLSKQEITKYMLYMNFTHG